MCQFYVKLDNFKFFGLNLEKLPNYVQYFGSNIVEVVAGSWVEVDGAGWRWVHGLVMPYRRVIFITPSNIKHFIERSSVTY